MNKLQENLQNKNYIPEIRGYYGIITVLLQILHVSKKVQKLMVVFGFFVHY